VDWKARKDIGYMLYRREMLPGLYTENISVGEVFGYDIGGNRLGL
jgi:hypothetical protein